MRHRARALWRIGRVVWHGLHGLLLVLIAFPALDREARLARIAAWARQLLRVLGIRLEVDGEFRPAAKLIVANHVSWIDIMALHAVCPEARFVSKADVQHWPLVRHLAAAAGTLYVDRDRRRDALRVVHQIAEALQAGDTVAVFPEGTTADGHALLPFHANLLQAAIATATPIQPVALRFSDAWHAVSPAAQYVGATTMVQSLWRLACGERVVVHLAVLPAQRSEHGDRRALAARMRELIDERLAAGRV